jgi:hypothetical protein
MKALAHSTRVLAEDCWREQFTDTVVDAITKGLDVS